MSHSADIPEAGRPHLRRALEQLPPHEPDAATWGRIEAQLTADAALARALPTLPAHEPDADLWTAIAAQLDTPPAVAPVAATLPAMTRPLWPARLIRRTVALAASVLLLLGVWWQLRPVRPAVMVARETIIFSEEEAGPTPVALPAATADPLEQQGLAFIAARCTAQPIVCQSREFRALRGQLRELETQETQLRQDARRFGASPELRREQARLVTLKATFTRQLVQLLIS